MTKLELFERFFLHKTTLYALFRQGEHIPIPQPTYVTQDMLAKHISGECTISVQLLHPSQNTVKAATIDIDVPVGDEGLQQALQEAIKFYQVASTWGIQTYCEFSGRRGFHIWAFFETPVLASVARRMFFFLMEESHLSGHAELFPAGDVMYVSETEKGLRWEGPAYKPVKLPLGKHQQGGWSGFIEWSTQDVSEMEFLEPERLFEFIVRQPLLLRLALRVLDEVVSEEPVAAEKVGGLAQGGVDGFGHREHRIGRLANLA